MKIVYFIHRARLPDRRVNLERAAVWFQFLADALPDHAILAPWIAYCHALDEEHYRERGMRDGKAIVESVTGQVVGVVCGPEMTDGCAADVQNLAAMGHPSVTITRLHLPLPPEGQTAIHLADWLATTVARAHENKVRNAIWNITYRGMPHGPMLGVEAKEWEP